MGLLGYGSAARVTQGALSSAKNTAASDAVGTQVRREIKCIANSPPNYLDDCANSRNSHGTMIFEKITGSGQPRMSRPPQPPHPHRIRNNHRRAKNNRVASIIEAAAQAERDEGKG